MKWWHAALVFVWGTVAVLVAAIVWRDQQSAAPAARPSAPSRLYPPDARGLPVLWLGDNYDSNHDGTPDMPLVFSKIIENPPARDPISGVPVRAPTHDFSLGYGHCGPPTPTPWPDEYSCPDPLSIDIFDICSAPPFDIAGPHAAVRGVDAEWSTGGELWVETADFTLRVGAAGKTTDGASADAIQVVEDLVGANPDAAAFKPGTPFRPRDEAATRRQCGLDGTPAP